MRTPQAVKDAAKFFLDEGDKLSHIGEYNGYEVYQVRFPEDEVTGYPIIFMYKEGCEVLELQYGNLGYTDTGKEANVFEIIRAAKKNKRERLKEARHA